ncbi:MAG: hypothetical protein KF746_01640 [Chitinophagaceae bacterium]|nr:hypothetical protein [Chitinophagaceae bacterium]
MKRNEHIEKELAEAGSTLTAFSNVLPYHLPENYFESFPDKMLNLVRAMEESAYPSALEEIHSLSPLLAGLKNKETLQVPDDYFAELTNDTLESIQKQSTEPAKVIPINKTRGAGKSWVRYAIAAALTGIIGITALSVWNNRQGQARELSATTNTKNFQANGMEMLQLSEETLATYLKDLPDDKTTPAIDSADAEFYDLALLKADDSHLLNILENIPYEELAEYEVEL